MLSADLYELTMVAGYFARGRDTLQAAASFELFVRHLPPHRRYLVVAGLEQALDWLEQLAFTADEIRWMRALPAFAGVPEAFFDYLRTFRFTGTVWAVPEGTIMPAQAPLLRVEAPLPEAQYAETALLAIVNFQTLVASKAARVVGAAAGRPVLEFGARRAHGLGAALCAARAAYLAGCQSTSYMEAGQRFGIPLSGTMAHSWVMSAATEMDAFKEYAAVFGDRSVLLLDTYDTVDAARAVAASGLQPGGVRLDSGDLLALSADVRRILDAAGLRQTRIFASGDLDEHAIAALVASHAPIDGFGVGTSMVTSVDAPALGGIYKLVELEEHGRPTPVQKRSPGKSTWPGRKQAFRILRDGCAVHDVVAFADEPAPPDSTPLLMPVMRAGRRIEPAPSLASVRDVCRASLAQLPDRFRDLSDGDGYEAVPSERLRDAI
ncbi:MAG TPA: nicotinate phosphoribosyltransferase [Vicinamibacterales bacterium]|nr:nicotinate phosphoribosyltransferase [Vicinamibacterales bacterium]